MKRINLAASALLCLMIVSLTACSVMGYEKKEPEGDIKNIFTDIYKAEKKKASLPKSAEKNNSAGIKNSANKKSVIKREDVSSYITLGSYKHVIDANLEITDEYIDKEFDMLIQMYSQNADYKQQGIIEEGMNVNIRYTANIDGESDEATGDFVIGNDDIAPGLDIQLMGKETGYIGSFDVIFQDGRKGTVDVVINYINGGLDKDMSDDEFVKQISGGIYESVAQYKAYLRSMKQEKLATQYGDEALMAIVKNSEFNGIEELCAKELEDTTKEIKQYGVAYDLEEAEVWHVFGCSTREEFEQYLKDYSVACVKERIAVWALAEVYNVNVTEEEVAEFKGNLSQYYTEEEMEEQFVEDYAIYSIVREKVLEKLLDDQK